MALISRKLISEKKNSPIYSTLQAAKEALAFHIKIGDKYFEAEIDHVLRNAVALRCKKWREFKCQARHKLKIDPKFIDAYYGC